MNAINYDAIKKLRECGVQRVAFVAGNITELWLYPAELTTPGVDPPLDGDEAEGTNGEVVRALTLLAGRGNRQSSGDEG